MIIEWEVNDNYMRGLRLQTFEMNDEYILEDCDNIEEALSYIGSFVVDDFESKVDWDYRNLNEIKEKLEKLFKEKNKKMITTCSECYHIINYHEERKWPDICPACGENMEKYKGLMSIELEENKNE